MTNEYERETASGEGWDLHFGDCVEVVGEIPSDSIHYTVFSPPSPASIRTRPAIRDMGNCALITMNSASTFSFGEGSFTG